MSESMRLKSFELIARDINSVDIESLHALTISVRWPHRPKDWEVLRQIGKGIVAVDEVGRVYGSAMWFPQGDQFATIGLVITTPRIQAQGGGRWLMKHVLDQCGDRKLSLNATHAAYPLYLSLGFATEMTVQMYQGDLVRSVDQYRDVGEFIYPLENENVSDIYEIDHAALKFQRNEMIDVISKISNIYIIKKNDEILGYSMCREFGRGYVIGPIVAKDDADAISLTAAHMNQLNGKFVRVDTCDRGGDFVKFLEQNGLSVAEIVTTMSKGFRVHKPMPQEAKIYGLAGHALG